MARAYNLAVLLASCPFLYAQSGPAITTGSEPAAQKYYRQLSQLLGFPIQAQTTTIDDLLKFIGYPISGAKLQSVDPAVLMEPRRAASADVGLGLPVHGLAGATLRDGDILAARFFAPKIVNVSVDQPKPGWRKLVRIRVRPGSDGARAGLETVIILFNFLAAGPQPFSGDSINTQVMLLAPAKKDHLYWMDFNPNGTLGFKLNASFDAADLPGGGTRDYFVPDGCNACHGSPGNFAPPMINYLDTDHWFDRLDDDFGAVKAAGTPLVFDAGTNDPSQPVFAAAFDVIRRFNEEALGQNAAVHANSFETQAARTWLRLHADSDAHNPPIARAFSTSGTSSWQPTEVDGLARLNRYCFRCHGSVRFSVFDRGAVVDKAGIIRQRIKPSAQQAKVPGFKMPPDRTLDSAELEALDAFIKNLK